MGEKPMTRSRPFTWFASAIFALIALVHVVRLFTDFQVVIGSHVIPLWFSYAGVIIPALISWMLCREARGTSGA
jgi:hypothetical protein